MSIETLVDEALEMLHTNTQVDLEALQIKLEEEADGFERELREGKRLKDILLRPTDDPMTQRIISAVFEDMYSYFEEELSKTVRGVGAKYRTILRALNTEVLVAVTLAHSLDSLIHKDSIANSIQRLASSIGKGIVTEVKVTQAFELNPLYMKRVEEGLRRKHAANKTYIKNVYDSAFNTVTLGELEYQLNEGDFIQIGKFGVDAMMKVGLIVKDLIFSNRREWSIYNIDPELYDYVMAFQPEIHKRAISAMFRYMIVEPDKWEGMTKGGFKSSRRKLYHPLISLKGLNKDLYQKYASEFTPEKMPKVFKFINYAQSIPYTIHPKAMELLHEIHRTGGGIMGVPSSNDPPEPMFPFGEDWNKDEATTEELDQFLGWKFDKAQWHEEVLQRRQKSRELSAFFGAVREGVEKLYFPCYFDFRGRLYYNSNPNPQGSDIAKAVLNFYNRKPLGKEGLFWLKVHLANSLGYDKVRFKERVAYVDSIWDKIEDALQAPILKHSAFGDDSPMVAYVTALEIKEAMDSGSPEDFLTNIPVHMDATVSGTQHFSAMLRDEVGAEYTNLIDLGQPTKADLYTRVADITLDYCNAEEDVEKFDVACKWVQFGIPRDLAKKPVMTYTYGVTKGNVVEHITGYMRGNCNTGFGKFKDSAYLTHNMFNAIAETIPATVTGMKFLQDVAMQVGDKPLEWYSPTGFWIHFNAKHQDSKRIAVRSAGVDLVWIRVTTDKTSKMKMNSGAAPNYVHSMDASHLCLVVNEMEKDGMDVVCIHDSIGTHAGDVTQLHKHIRESFINLYTEDVLDSFRDQVGSTVDLPEYGSFDLNHVRDSEFFFC